MRFSAIVTVSLYQANIIAVRTSHPGISREQETQLHRSSLFSSVVAKAMMVCLFTSLSAPFLALQEILWAETGLG